LDGDTLKNPKDFNNTIKQFDVEKPSTKEASVTSTTIMTSRLVGALGGKIRPIICIRNLAFEGQLFDLRVDNQCFLHMHG
jgi:hypothetical protein